MYVGKESMNASKIPVYAMPRFINYLRSNGPWSQLVTLGNIDVKPLQSEAPIMLDSGLVVIPIVVPHRDEFSETVGFKIIGTKSRRFISLTLTNGIFGKKALSKK